MCLSMGRVQKQQGAQDRQQMAQQEPVLLENREMNILVLVILKEIGAYREEGVVCVDFK